MIVVYTCIALLAFAAEVGHTNEESVYQSPQSFVDNAFNGNTPVRQKLWIRGELKNALTEILGHSPPWLRVGYWAQDGRTAWILEEIGKEQPITTGVVVSNHSGSGKDGAKIEQVRVLVYRESRGFEVRYPFFTNQFNQASLDQDNRLDQHIDGITGATLSVSALERIARAALLLHTHSTHSNIILAKQ